MLSTVTDKRNGNIYNTYETKIMFSIWKNYHTRKLKSLIWKHKKQDKLIPLFTYFISI